MKLRLLDSDTRQHEHYVPDTRCPLRMAEIVEIASLEHASAVLLGDDNEVVAMCHGGKPWLKMPRENS